MVGRQQTFGAKLKAGERGVSLVLVTLFIFVLFGFAAISIDVSRVYIEKHKAHIATDAAALAGVAKLGNPAVSTNQQALAAITEADAIANANGVTDAEITAAPTNRYPAQIQVGSWGSGTFTALATPYNAVRVPAKRAVPLYFGKVVGSSQMTPVVDSIATIGAIAVPYGIPSNKVGVVGSTTTLQAWSPGNWGPLDFCGGANGSKATEAILNGGGCYATVGQVTGTGTGFDGIAQGFQDLYNKGLPIVLPVTSAFPNGNKEVTIQTFVIVQLLDDGSKGGKNWNLNVKILGIGFDALKQNGLGPVRSLVE